MKAQSQDQALSVNRLLHRLPINERRRLDARATRVDLRSGSVLCAAGKRMSHVYFPHSGFISLSTDGEPGEVVHVGHVGDEGMLGLPVAIGASFTTMHAVVHGDGQSAQIDSSEFAALLHRCPMLRHSLLTYSHRLMVQIAQAVVCNTLHPVSARFARWLLTASDRMHSPTLCATQEQIAMTLGVLRLSVSQAASEFKEQGLITYRRGKITIESQSGLKARACACYAVTDKIFRE